MTVDQPGEIRSCSYLQCSDVVLSKERRELRVQRGPWFIERFFNGAMVGGLHSTMPSTSRPRCWVGSAHGPFQQSRRTRARRMARRRSSSYDPASLTRSAQPDYVAALRSRHSKAYRSRRPGIPRVFRGQPALPYADQPTGIVVDPCRFRENPANRGKPLRLGTMPESSAQQRSLTPCANDSVSLAGRP